MYIFLLFSLFTSGKISEHEESISSPRFDGQLHNFQSYVLVLAYSGGFVIILDFMFRFQIYNFIFRWCLQITNANKNQQNTIKTLLIISST